MFQTTNQQNMVERGYTFETSRFGFDVLSENRVSIPMD
jgi:hypothetical protein